MKRVAAIILTRNLPAETDCLVEKLKLQEGDAVDIFVVESGSDQGNLSKYVSWWANWEESTAYGLRYPRGINFAFVNLLKEGKYEDYDYFILLCNDVILPDTPMVKTLVDLMEEHKRLGILSPCSPEWGEKNLIGDNGIRYFWYVNHNAWIVRRRFIDDIREIENPTYINAFYDGNNFRGYESDIEVIVKGYANNWATAITTSVIVGENKDYLLTKAALMHTDSFADSLVKCHEEGKKWMRAKYGFNSRWQMQMYSKFFYEKFFEHNPQLKMYQI